MMVAVKSFAAYVILIQSSAAASDAYLGPYWPNAVYPDHCRIAEDS